MHIGLLRVSLHLPTAQSLKDKRRELLHLREKIKNRFNVSVSEVGDHDKWQKMDLALVMVASQKTPIDEVFAKVLGYIGTDPNVEIIDQRVEYL